MKKTGDNRGQRPILKTNASKKSSGGAEDTNVSRRALDNFELGLMLQQAVKILKDIETHFDSYTSEAASFAFKTLVRLRVSFLACSLHSSLKSFRTDGENWLAACTRELTDAINHPREMILWSTFSVKMATLAENCRLTLSRNLVDSPFDLKWFRLGWFAGQVYHDPPDPPPPVPPPPRLNPTETNPTETNPQGSKPLESKPPGSKPPGSKSPRSKHRDPQTESKPWDSLPESKSQDSKPQEIVEKQVGMPVHSPEVKPAFHWSDEANRLFAELGIPKGLVFPEDADLKDIVEFEDAPVITDYIWAWAILEFGLQRLRTMPAQTKPRPAQERDQLFLHWYETMGEEGYREPSKIRIRWNREYPENEIELEAVKKALKRAKKRRADGR